MFVNILTRPISLKKNLNLFSFLLQWQISGSEREPRFGGDLVSDLNDEKRGELPVIPRTLLSQL